MSTENDHEKVRTTVIVSPKNAITWADLKKWATNLLIFTVPIFGATFFGGLQAGLNPKTAAILALTSLYGPLADLFKKYRQSDIRLADGSEVQ